MKIRAEFLMLALLALSLPAHGEKADRSKPVNIEADTVRMDEVHKVASYEGHVILSQGTLMITADRIDIRQDDRGFASGEAQGSPVYFRQKVEGLNEFTEGWAKRVEYDSREEKLKLLGEARLKRGEEELRGNLISYDGKTETYQAVGGSAETPGRVRAVIRPKPAPDARP